MSHVPAVLEWQRVLMIAPARQDRHNAQVAKAPGEKKPETWMVSAWFGSVRTVAEWPGLAVSERIGVSRTGKQRNGETGMGSRG